MSRDDLREMLSVAPHAGAWIETKKRATRTGGIYEVAPHAGAWIETSGKTTLRRLMLVAPHAGAWIETPVAGSSVKIAQRRTPRGCVD